MSAPARRHSFRLFSRLYSRADASAKNADVVFDISAAARRNYAAIFLAIKPSLHPKKEAHFID